MKREYRQQRHQLWPDKLDDRPPCLLLHLDEVLESFLGSVQNATLSMGVDHPAYQAAIDPIAADVRASLLNDLATA